MKAQSGAIVEELVHFLVMTRTTRSVLSHLLAHQFLIFQSRIGLTEMQLIKIRRTLLNKFLQRSQSALRCSVNSLSGLARIGWILLLHLLRSLIRQGDVYSRTRDHEISRIGLR